MKGNTIPCWANISSVGKEVGPTSEFQGTSEKHALQVTSVSKSATNISMRWYHKIFRSRIKLRQRGVGNDA